MLKKAVLKQVVVAFLLISFGLSSQNSLKLFFPQHSGVYADTALVFSWRNVTGVVSYDLQIALDPGFASIYHTNNLSTNSDTVFNMPAGLYYWRCSANLTTDTISSVITTFQIISLDSQLKLWWDAGDGVTKDGNNKISQWADRSGNGNDGLQADGIKQPLYQDSMINHRPMVRFDGLTQAIAANPFTLSPPAQVFMVFNKPDNGPNEYIFDGGGVNRLRLSLTGANSYLLYAGAFFIPGNAGAIGDKILTVKQGLSNSMIRSNMNTIGVGDPGSSAINGFVLGEYGIPTTDPSVHAQIDVAEVLIYADTLSTQRTQDIENYLKYKYAPPVVINASEAEYFCPVTLFPQKDYSSYQWSTGATTKNIEVQESGTYYVTVQDNFGFASSDTLHLLIDRPAYNQLNDSLLCVGNTIEWNIELAKNIYTYEWQDGSTDSTFNISNAGEYWVKITDSLGCFRYSDTINITLDNFSQIASLGNDTTLCAGNIIELQSGQIGASSYNWSGGSTGNKLPIDTSGIYSLTVTNINGCEATDSISVTISGTAPLVSFNAPNVCLGDSTVFTDNSTPLNGSTLVQWKWHFGDNDSSHLQHPAHLYSDTGNYTIKLIVTTDAGCSAEQSQVIRVYELPTADFLMLNLCQNTLTHFTDLSSPASDIQNWQWNFGDISGGSANSSSLQNPTYLYNNTGNYSVQLIVQNTYMCADTISKILSVSPKPVANFYHSLACENNVVNFTDSSIIPQGTSIQSSFWNFGGNNTSSQLNPTHVFTSYVNYHVTHIITIDNGCSDTIIKTVPVHPKPYAMFTSGNACENAPVQFNDISIIPASIITGWKWTFDNADTLLYQHPLYSYTNSGNHQAKLVVTSADGCKDSLTQTIVVHPAPIVNFNFSPTYGSPPLTVNFNNTSTGASLYLWNFGDGNQSSIENPQNIYSDTGNYTITLIGLNSFGCKDTAFNSITVVPKTVDIVIFGISAILQNDFLNISLQLINKGTVDITSLNFYVRINEGTYIKESWAGIIPKGSIYNHNLSTSFFLEDIKHFICISALLPNGINDANPLDNEMCKSLDETILEVYPLFPNPANQTLTIPLYLPTDEILEVSLYNITGQKIRLLYSGEMSRGMQFITNNVSDLNPGLYSLQISFKNQTVVRKFIKE